MIGKASNNSMRRFRVMAASNIGLGLALFFAFDGGEVGQAPVRGHGLPRLDRTDFAGRLVADRENEIEHQRVWARELVPGLAAKLRRGHAELFKRGPSPGVRHSLWDDCRRNTH